MIAEDNMFMDGLSCDIFVKRDYYFRGSTQVNFYILLHYIKYAVGRALKMYVILYYLILLSNYEL